MGDRYVKRYRLLIGAFVGATIVTIPSFMLVTAGNYWLVIVVVTIFALLLAIPLATNPAMLAESYQRRYRVTGYALSYNVGVAIAGGTAPMIASWLIFISRSTIPA